MIQEIVVYRISEEGLPDFLETRAHLMEELRQLAGFVSEQHSIGLNDRNVRVDVITWESKELARSARVAFCELSYAEAFLKYVDGTPIVEELFEITEGALPAA